MKSLARIAPASFAAIALALIAVPAPAQDGDGAEYIVVTAQRREQALQNVPVSIGSVPERPPVIGLRRQADSAFRHIEITSDSLDEDMRKTEVQAMFLAALDRAGKEGLSLVTGQFEVTTVTRENWRDLFPGLAAKPGNEDDEDDEDDEDEDDKVLAGYEDDGDTATARLMVKTKLTGSIAEAERKISAFVKKVPATGRSEIKQKGELGLTIVKPEQYRDEIYRRIAEGAKRAMGFYGPDYGVEVIGLDREIAWAQVSNTEVFLYIPYSFTVAK